LLARKKERKKGILASFKAQTLQRMGYVSKSSETSKTLKRSLFGLTTAIQGFDE
jgi:hypothetical protein